MQNLVCEIKSYVDYLNRRMIGRVTRIRELKEK